MSQALLQSKQRFTFSYSFNNMLVLHYFNEFLPTFGATDHEDADKFVLAEK